MEVLRSEYHMGTNIEIILLDKSKGRNMHDDMQLCFDVFSEHEDIFSRFRKESLLSQLNERKYIPRNEVFENVLKYAYEVSQKTEHYFNPYISLNDIGYDTNFDDLKSKDILHSRVRKIADFEYKISEKYIHIPENISLDLGGVVKGFSCDRVASMLQDWGYKHFLVNAGGDIWVENKKGNEREIIGIENPYSPGSEIAQISVGNESVCSSGAYKRKWKIGEQDFHHIITPQTGANNYDILSLSLVGNSVAESDAYATALLAMGREKAVEFIEVNNMKALVFLNSGEKYVSNELQKAIYNLTFL